MRKAGKIILIIETLVFVVFTILSLVLSLTINKDLNADHSNEPGYAFGAIFIAIFLVFGYFGAIVFGLFAIVGIVCSILSLTKKFDLMERSLGITLIVFLPFFITGILFLKDHKKRLSVD